MLTGILVRMASIVLGVPRETHQLHCSSATRAGSSGKRHGMALKPSGNAPPEKYVCTHSHRLT
ncbi:hypothetical protein DPMN_043887 [Dreissena polymorpha]|uniref:Uncharacterized protein n=1 Tax=Dreissena polymorpha TaxID=45954 RepID=A0A9D4HY91_DREPO|nr:hypothetical protein DPMN_043887 [Dreissena polymorpha]